MVSCLWRPMSRVLILCICFLVLCKGAITNHISPALTIIVCNLFVQPRYAKLIHRDEHTHYHEHTHHYADTWLRVYLLPRAHTPALVQPAAQKYTTPPILLGVVLRPRREDTTNSPSVDQDDYYLEIVGISTINTSTCTDHRAHDHLCEHTHRFAPNGNRDRDPTNNISPALAIT